MFQHIYRKVYNSQHVLIRLLEEWRQHLDNNKVVGGVFVELTKAFDCVPPDLLIAKLAAYSADENLLMYIYSYLSNKNQCVRINNVHSRSQNANFWGTSRVHCWPYIIQLLF